MRSFTLTVLVLASACGSTSSSQVDASTPETLDQTAARWNRESADGGQTGVSTTFALQASKIQLSTEAQVALQAPFSITVERVFFVDATVEGTTGLLIIEGSELQVTSGGASNLAVTSLTGTSAGLTFTPKTSLSTNETPLTFPSEWADAKGDFVSGWTLEGSIAASSISGFTRAVLLTTNGAVTLSTPSISFTGASKTVFGFPGVFHAASLNIDDAPVAFSGDFDGGTQMMHVHGGSLAVSGTTVRTSTPVQKTQALIDGGVQLAAEVETRFNSTPVTVVASGKTLVPVIIRETSRVGDAVLSKVEISGTGAAAVSVELANTSLLGSLWKLVGQDAVSTLVLVVPLIALSPALILFDALECLFGTCPRPYPAWLDAGGVERFDLLVQGTLPAGEYDAEVRLTGANHAPQIIPVHFTVTAP